MSPLGVVAVLLAAGLTSWALRVGAITLLPADRLPPRARRLLDHAAPAAIAAMVGAGVAGGGSVTELASRTPLLLGALVTAVVAWRSRGLVLPVVAGLATAGLLGVLWAGS